MKSGPRESIGWVLAFIPQPGLPNTCILKLVMLIGKKVPNITLERPNTHSSIHLVSYVVDKTLQGRKESVF